MTTSDPVDCLVEIVQLTMKRMTSAKVGADEALVLGEIAGVAIRLPEVMQRVNEVMKEQEQQ